MKRRKEYPLQHVDSLQHDIEDLVVPFSSPGFPLPKRTLNEISPEIVSRESDMDVFLDEACALIENRNLRDRSYGQLPLQSTSFVNSHSVVAFDKFRLLSFQCDEECLMLQVEVVSSLKRVTLELRGCWAFSTLRIGAIVHVVYTTPERISTDQILVINDEQHLLILEPFEFISPTKIADASTCERRVVLKDTFIQNQTSRETVFGNLKHSLLQAALEAWSFDEEFLFLCVPDLVFAAGESLFQIELSDKEACEELMKGIPSIVKWAQQCVGSQAPGIKVHLEGGIPVLVRILRLIGVEQSVMSPMFGMKGVIDCVCVVEQRNRLTDIEGTRWICPLEIKTGKPVTRIEHRAQVMMYCALLSDRYQCSVRDGLLLQACFDPEVPFTMLGVRLEHHELRELLRIRNSLCGLGGNIPKLSQSADCSRCFQRNICALVEESDTQPLKGYFSRWYSLLHKESQLQHSRSSTELVEVRNLVLKSSTTIDLEYLAFSRPLELSTMVWGQFQVNDMVLLSLQDAHYGLFQGIIQTILECEVTVVCRGSMSWKRCLPNSGRTILWTMEKTAFKLPSSLPTLAHFTLERDDHVHMQRIHALLVDRTSRPLFWDSEANPFLRKVSGPVLQHWLESPEIASLEQLRQRLAIPFQHIPAITAGTLWDVSKFTLDQMNVLGAVLSVRELLCIVGGPGAGKSHVLSFVVNMLSQRFGKSVLVVSYTHTACDHLCAKILNQNANMPLVRIGNKSSISPSLHPLVLPTNTPRPQLESLLYQPDLVVATTCFQVKHTLLQRKRFDYCILDEASQVTELHALASWLQSSCLVLVGDHRQLPPLMLSQPTHVVESALEVAMSISPSSVCYLNTQFRMNAALTVLANRLFYSNQLSCGAPWVANQHLRLSSSIQSQFDWIARCLHAQTSSLVFVDTDGIRLDLEEKGSNGGIVNWTEVHLVSQLVRRLIEANLPPRDLGVISPYRAQLHHLASAISNPHVEVDTVDKFQGREKECIVFSMVRSNLEQDLGNLLADNRRLNVAFSRARSKLIVVGSQAMLKSNPTLRTFLAVVQEGNGMIAVQSGDGNI